MAATLVSACGGGGMLEGLSSKTSNAVVGGKMTGAERRLAFHVLSLVNEEREAEGLEPLVWDEAAAEAAYAHCVDMRLRGFVSHWNPDGEDACARLRRAEVDLLSCGENIAQGHKSPEGLVYAWMRSPGHRAAIMNPGFTRCGIGVHTGGGGPWWTQDFIAPPLDR